MKILTLLTSILLIRSRGSIYVSYRFFLCFRLKYLQIFRLFFDAVDPMRPLLDYIGALPLAVPKKKNELVHALCRHIAVTRIEKSLKQ